MHQKVVDNLLEMRTHRSILKFCNFKTFVTIKTSPDFARGRINIRAQSLRYLLLTNLFKKNKEQELRLCITQVHTEDLIPFLHTPSPLVQSLRLKPISLHYLSLF